MRIYPPERASSQGWTEYRYRIESERAEMPSECLRFSVPEEYAGWVSDRMEAPVMAMLFLAMFRGESLHVDAPLSPQFHYGVRQIQNYFHLWYPETLSKVKVECDGFEETISGADAVGACFSGGVDSYYTLLHHREDTEPLSSHRIGYGLFVHGFDIPLDESAFYERLADRYERVLSDLSVRLIRCRTNLRELVDPFVPWMTTHGAAIQAAGLFLQNGLRRFLIPSTNRYSLLNPPIGSNPFTDSLASTESMEFLHHGCEASRIEKVLAIADWAPARENLRVCFQPPGKHLNCGRCCKCHKVMAPLWLTGKLEDFTSFPSGFDPGQMESSCFSGIDMSRFAPERSYTEELCDLARLVNPGALDSLPIPQEERPAPPCGYKAFFQRIFRQRGFS